MTYYYLFGEIQHGDRVTVTYGKTCVRTCQNCSRPCLRAGQTSIPAALQPHRALPNMALSHSSGLPNQGLVLSIFKSLISAISGSRNPASHRRTYRPIDVEPILIASSPLSAAQLESRHHTSSHNQRLRAITERNRCAPFYLIC